MGTKLRSPTPPVLGESPRTEVGEIDTRAPFKSVKAAVSLFGEVAISSDRSSAVKKTKAPQTEVSFFPFWFFLAFLFVLSLLKIIFCSYVFEEILVITQQLRWNFALEL